MISRREFGKEIALGAAAAASVGSWNVGAQEAGSLGAVRGEPTAEKVGLEVLAGGGNVVDSIVAAALTAAVVVPHQTGMGGYGGHATLALDGGKRITSIDFNSMAPAAAKSDMFSGAFRGRIDSQKHMYGWLSAGVPGILAGLELTLKRFGTRTFRDMLQPAGNWARKERLPIWRRRCRAKARCQAHERRSRLAGTLFPPRQAARSDGPLFQS
jgi:gamma-glutamyltranspeptidase / glutathione hydrolase